MSVSVILVAYHSDAWLPACLSTLSEASATQLHLVLVDNAGNTLIDEIDRSAFDAEVLHTPTPMGFAEANNYALTHASHLEETILFLNQDTISPAGWLDQCLDGLASDPQLGAVSPLIRTYDGRGWDPSFLACFPRKVRPTFSEHLKASREEILPVQNVPAPALVVRKETLRQAGPFDPVFGSYYEDYDLCRRIRRCGYTVGFCRAATIHHYSGSTTTSRERELKRMRQIIRNRLIHQLREAGDSRWPILLQHVLFGLPHRIVRGLRRTPSSQSPSATLKAYWDLMGIAGRLVSSRRDEMAWQEYLETLGWPHRIPGLISEKMNSEYV